MLTATLLTVAFLIVAISAFILGRESRTLTKRQRETLLRRIRDEITLSEAARLMAYASNGKQAQKRRARKAAEASAA